MAGMVHVQVVGEEEAWTRVITDLLVGGDGAGGTGSAGAGGGAGAGAGSAGAGSAGAGSAGADRTTGFARGHAYGHGVKRVRVEE